MQAQKQIVDDQDEEVFETHNVNDDFDQINEEKQQYQRHTAAYSQMTQHVDYEELSKKASQQMFNQESALSIKNRNVLQKSRQAHIGNRLIQIRLEMQKLQKQLDSNMKYQEEMQQQANSALDNMKKEQKDVVETSAQNNLQVAKNQHQIASQQLQQFAFLKSKLIKIYKMQGFKQMVRSNPNMSQFLGVIQQDFIREGDEDNMISAQMTGRSVNMMELSRTIEKLRHAHFQKQTEKERWNEAPQVNINIMFDKSQKDIGVLIKLNNLMKRLHLIQHLVGDWKPNNKKYSNVTEQIRYVQKKMELLNESKMVYFQKRAGVLKQEVAELQQQISRDPSSLHRSGTMSLSVQPGQSALDKLEQRQGEIGHDKKTIDSLFATGKSVKGVCEQIPSIVERLEQKRKIHDMSAQILNTIEKLETQQQNILNSAAKENKQVLEALQKGMKDNSDTIKSNIAHLKKKIGIETVKKEDAKEGKTE